MNKIQKTSKTIDIILSIMFWSTLVIALGYGAFQLIIAARGEGVMGTESELILGSYKLTLTEKFDWSKNPMAVSMSLSVIFTAVFAMYEIKVLKDIFRPMAQGLPFTRSVSKSIKKAAWIELVYGILDTAVDSIMSAITYKTLDIPSLFSPEKVQSCSILTNSDISFLVWFVILMLLSHVFEYGEELQRLSDETL